jgi:hypothetical protein
MDAAITLMNTVPRQVAERPENALILSTLALEVGEGMRRLGAVDTAEKIVGLGHELRRHQFGRFHPRTGLSSLYAARICMDQRRWSDAHKYYEASVVGLGPYHPFNAAAYAERAFAVQMIAPNARLFPEFVMSAPRPYWRRLVNFMAGTTLQLPLDLRMAVLLNVSCEMEETLEDSGDLSRPLLVTAYQHACTSNDERGEELEEVLQERGWCDDQVRMPPTLPEAGSDTESFWTAPDRDDDSRPMDALAISFKLFEGAAEASAGRKSSAIDAFERVRDASDEDTIEHWAARGCLQLLDRGWKLRHNQFKPEIRAIEALALSKLPKTTQTKLRGIELSVRKGSLDVSFLGAELTEAQQKRAAQAVQSALTWITDRSEEAS